MTRPPDQDARDRIRTQTGTTLFVNAGAGSGKTSALVDRVLTLVLNDGIRLANVAAVTFTEKAGAELRDRLRGEFEQRWRAGGLERELAAQALDDLDGAAIGTLHSFAQRILAEHPIEAGLPPIIEVLDEVGSSVAFDERWAEVQSALLDDDTIAQPLLLGMAAGLQLKHLRSLALLLGKDWDLIDERILVGEPPEVEVPDLGEYIDRVRKYLDVRAHCTDDNDGLLRKLAEMDALVATFDSAIDVESGLAVVQALGALKIGRIGRRENWTLTIEDVRDDGRALVAEAEQIAADALDRCLRVLTCWLARQVRDAAQLRRREGRLEFHDLLVLARDLLRRDADVRAALHNDYQRLLLDEFQDTDPIQIELAARICGGAPADAPAWQGVAIPPGRLFVVGDAKQSIYRFRRASIITYLEAQQHIGEPAGLTTNFRSVAPVLDWINGVFGELIQPQPGQPEYVPLDGHRPDRGTGPAVTVLGAEPHPDDPRADPLREREAADVAAAIRQVIDGGWTIFDDRTKQWRPARHEDIAVLVPARTSLPFLEDALDAAGVPYRAEASSLVYHAAEVRSLLACARAVADRTDALALVTALRSPLFGCGDDDLWRWKQAGGRFAIHSEVNGPENDGPVGRALAYLRRLSYDARWMTPSEVLGAIVADRRMLEVSATGPRARDAWRRLRFVVDQARAWSEVSHGGLRAYLAWAAHQGEEVSRVAEAVLPETDADAVRVMTIHAAKGLEFPIVVLSGMTSQARRQYGVALIWPPDGGYAVRTKSGVQTLDFAAAQPVDEQMDDLERLRLLYVATTRARDHLIVSLHRGMKPKDTAAHIVAATQRAANATAFARYEFAPPETSVSAVTPPPPYDAWLAGIEVARAASRRQPAITASGLEGTEPEIVLDPAADPGQAKGPRDLELPPWSKGRYGSAIGRAVHAVLQAVDLATGDGLEAAVVAQTMAEGVVGQEELIRALAQSALASELVKRAAAREHWRETYVGTSRPDGVVVEGYVDLIYRDDDGTLVIVDYKTDAVPAGAIGSRVAYYKPQLDAYREALAAATGARVRTALLFLNPDKAVEVDIGG
jgi:ATP-dependent helicase/nuclease subunit A